MSEIRLNVTEKDIENGTPMDPHSCPIATSLKRRGCTNPNVDNDYIRFTFNGKRYKIKTSDRISNWIDSFDWDWASVEPTSIKLKLE